MSYLDGTMLPGGDVANITDNRLQTQAMPIDDLVDSVRRGEIRIPSFQRGLRWKRIDVIRLFDSIVRGYPIGNLLLWQRPAKARSDLRIGELQIDAAANDRALFVVDGQQRLTSLANALSDEGRESLQFGLAYDVQEERFVPAEDKSSSEIPLPVVFDLARLIRWYSDHPDLLEEPALLDRANRVAKAIREFRVPVYIVDQPDESVLRDIFDRMNNYGKQLTRAEVFTALHEAGSGEEAAQEGHDFTRIAAQVHASTGFGVIDDDTVFLCVLARRGPDISRDIRREFPANDEDRSGRPTDFPDETASDAFEGTARALLHAVHFLQGEARVPHLAFLPYRYLLVVLTRFYAHFPQPTSATSRDLRRWYWRAAGLGASFSGGNLTAAMRSLNSRIQPSDEARSVQGLLEVVSSQNRVLPPVETFRTDRATSRVLLTALWSLRPRPLRLVGERSPYPVDDLLDALGESDTAVGQVLVISRSAEPPLRGAPANRLFVPAPDVELPLSPTETLARLAADAEAGDLDAEAVLTSYSISPPARRALLVGDVALFLQHRQQDLERLYKRFVDANAEWDFETPPSLDSLVLDEELEFSDTEPPRRD